MKLRSLVLSALLALGIAPMANAAEEVVPTVSSFDFLVDNSGSMLTSPLLNARSKMDLAKDVMTRVNAQIPDLPYQGSVHLFSPDGTPQPLGAWGSCRYGSGHRQDQHRRRSRRPSDQHDRRYYQCDSGICRNARSPQPPSS